MGFFSLWLPFLFTCFFSPCSGLILTCAPCSTALMYMKGYGLFCKCEKRYGPITHLERRVQTLRHGNRVPPFFPSQIFIELNIGGSSIHCLQKSMLSLTLPSTLPLHFKESDVCVISYLVPPRPHAAPSYFVLPPFVPPSLFQPYKILPLSKPIKSHTSILKGCLNVWSLPPHCLPTLPSREDPLYSVHALRFHGWAQGIYLKSSTVSSQIIPIRVSSFLPSLSPSLPSFFPPSLVPPSLWTRGSSLAVEVGKGAEGRPQQRHP